MVGVTALPEYADAYEASEAEWRAQSQALGHPVGLVQGGSKELGIRYANRVPIRPGHQSETVDGKPACKQLMGNYRGRDGGITHFPFSPLSVVFGANDFAVMIRFVPRDVLSTDMLFTWLVDKDAAEGEDYDVARLMEFWDITTKQDKTIVEDNQAGVLSSRYEPGPYSRHEATVVACKDWYLQQLSGGCL